MAMNEVSERASLLTDIERSRALACLASTRDEVLESVSGLNESQWRFKPSAAGWSIVEILEHVVMVEDRVHSILLRMPDSALAEPGQRDSQRDDSILRDVPNRTVKLEAPPLICPTQQWRPEYARERFLAGRAKTVEMLDSAPALRGHVISHPVLGPWDGYQWILATAAHSARHADQIREVKEDLAFPKLDAAALVVSQR